MRLNTALFDAYFTWGFWTHLYPSCMFPCLKSLLISNEETFGFSTLSFIQIKRSRWVTLFRLDIYLAIEFWFVATGKTYENLLSGLVSISVGYNIEIYFWFSMEFTTESTSPYFFSAYCVYYDLNQPYQFSLHKNCYTLRQLLSEAWQNTTPNTLSGPFLELLCERPPHCQYSQFNGKIIEEPFKVRFIEMPLNYWQNHWLNQSQWRNKLIEWRCSKYAIYQYFSIILPCLSTSLFPIHVIYTKVCASIFTYFRT